MPKYQPPKVKLPLTANLLLWAWLFSIAVFCLWWADLIVRGNPGGGEALFGLVLIGAGWFAYIRGSGWVLERLLNAQDKKQKPPSDRWE